MKSNMLGVVVAAAAAVASLCTVANAAVDPNGTWTYKVARDAQIYVTSTAGSADTTHGADQVVRVANHNMSNIYWQAWFGDWSAADKADMLAKINAGMAAGRTYTLTLKLALEADATYPTITFTPTVAAFRADQDWVEAQVTTNSASTGVAWTYNGGTAANGMQNLPMTINTNNFDNFGKGLNWPGATGPAIWSSVNLDPTVTTALLTGTDVRGLRGYSVTSQANINDRIYTKEKWGVDATDPVLVLTVVPEPATLGMLSLCSLALLGRRRVHA